MKEIRAWETSDGSVFGEKEEAKLHEEKIAIKLKMKELAGIYYFPNMTSQDLEDILVEIMENNK